MKLIKGNDWLELGDVKPVDWNEAGDLRREAPVRTVSTTPRSAGLEDEIENLRKLLADAETRHQRDLATKVEQARRDAADSYRRNDEEALAALTASLGNAAVDALSNLGGAERLALLLCDAALARVFSNPAAHQDLVARAIRRQVEQLRADLVLAVRVSVDDFPDAVHIRQLQEALGLQFDIKRDPRLLAGCCRIDLRLGHIDLSLPAHWNALQAELRRLADLEKPA